MHLRHIPRGLKFLGSGLLLTQVDWLIVGVQDVQQLNGTEYIRLVEARNQYNCTIWEDLIGPGSDQADDSKNVKKRTLCASSMLLLTLLSRLPFQAKIPYGLDSVQFVLGLDHYDVTLHQPHPPGYFLFVMLGRAFSMAFRDPNLSFIALNILFSVLGALVFYRLGRALFGSGNGLLSALLLVTSPLFWFHGEVALSNVADCFFVCLVTWFCWKTLNGDPRFVYYSAVALGLSGGVRQNTLVFLLPLWLFSMARVGLRRQLSALLLLLVTVLLWYFPMASLSGGVYAYQTALRDHWLNSNWHGLTFSWIPFNLVVVSYFILLGLGAGSLFLLLGLLFWLENVRLHVRENRRLFLFFVFWLAPPLMFFVLVYSHPIQTGHSLIYLPGFLLLLPKAVQLTCAQFQRLWSPRNRIREKENQGDTGKALAVSSPEGFADAVIVVLAVINCIVFLGMNTAVSRARLEDYESKVADMVTSIRSQCPPDQTILVNDDFMFLGFRDSMYHLPEYHTYQPRLYSIAGRSLLFSGFERQTRLVDYVEVPSRVRFFVLNADEFIRNPGLIQGIDLSTLPVDHFLKSQCGVRWLRGDARELPRFFPAIHFVFDE
jgi:hypothetical protein